LKLSQASFARIALSSYVLNGVSAAFGLFLISGSARLLVGSFAAAVATLGVIVVIPPDSPAPLRGKWLRLLPAVFIGTPLFYGVRLLHATPLHLALLLIPATFCAFLGAAWGRRGVPISISAMFAMVFALAVPASDSGGASTLYFAAGALSFVLYAAAANAVLNARYRSQILAETLLAMASLMRIQSVQLICKQRDEGAGSDPIGLLLREQAAFADQLQITRDMLLESPRTPRRQQLAGILVRLLETRDALLACELDVDLLVAGEHHQPLLMALRANMERCAAALERLADSFLKGRLVTAIGVEGTRVEEAQALIDASADVLARGLAARIQTIGKEVTALYALARRELEPDLAVVRASWRMFISPTVWSWRPLATLWHWDAPPLRHALRAALAIGSAYALSLWVPWATHADWILLTIVVVLRGSLAQTLERRNSRVAGTLLGSVVAGALLVRDPSAVLVMFIVILAQGVAHAFAVKRYLATAVAATVLAILQAHLLNAHLNPAFQVFERIADTFIGVAIAWAFSYVLPAWERTQMPSLTARALDAQARYARLSLELGQRETPDQRPELDWRLARREAYDSLSALVQAAQRSLAEPRAVRPPLPQLELLLAHSYQLLAQLTAVKTMLMLDRERLDSARFGAPLRDAIKRMVGSLKSGGVSSSSPDSRASAPSDGLTLPDPFSPDVTPWLLRRLQLAVDLAERVQNDAQRVCGVGV
jgi:uncharacterized membrane protein YccC